MIKTLLNLSLITLFLSTSCDNNNHQKTSGINIDTFSSIPSEIDGAGCYFSSNEKHLEKGVYIYVNDFAGIAFMKIKGKLVHFKLIKDTKIDEENSVYDYEGENYQLKVESKFWKNAADYNTMYKGKITLKNKNGDSTTINFVGYCGC